MMYREILSIDRWQHNYAFNRDLAIMLLYQGEYKPAFDYFKKALEFSDKEQKDFSEGNYIMSGILASKKQQ